MNLTSALLVVVSLIVVVSVFVLRTRWLSRYSHGFLLSVLLALSVVAFTAGSVVAIRGYEVARDGVMSELRLGLENVAQVVEQQVRSAVRIEQSRLTTVSSAFGRVMDRATPEQLRSRLEAVEQAEPRYLQVDLIDPRAQVIANSTATGAPQPPSRVSAAYALEGKPFITIREDDDGVTRQMLLSAPVVDAGGHTTGAVLVRFDLRSLLHDLISTTHFNTTGYTVLVGSHDHVIAHSKEERLGEDFSGYEAVRRVRAGERDGSVVAPNRAGVDRLFVYRTIANPSMEAGARPWILLTEMDQSEVLAILRRLKMQLLISLGIVGVVLLVIAVGLTQSIRGPLYQLAQVAEHIRDGKLDTVVPVTGRDAVGRMAAALASMAKGLKERDRIRDLFGRYIASDVAGEMLASGGVLEGKSRRVTVLMSDIRGFTRMSEAMPPVQVVAFLNEYFTEMVDAVLECGGVLDKFIGDGLLAVFGSLAPQPDHAERAIRAALRMRAKLAKINGERASMGLPAIAIGIGIHTDDCIVGNIGSNKRLEYTVVGDGVNVASRVEALNKQFGTTILTTETTYEAIKNEFECRQMPEAEIRGRASTFRFYEVISEKADAPAAAAPARV
jgi:class 3 adenylate cyclase